MRLVINEVQSESFRLVTERCRVWYRALSLGYACIRRSGIILIPWATFVPNFISFAASMAELAHGEKSRTQSLTQSPSLFDALGSEAFASNIVSDYIRKCK